MSDLRPPSLRDTRSLTDVVRHHGLLLEKLAPGLIGGRSRIPDPLALADDLAADGDTGNDGDTDEPQWWDEDRYQVTGPGGITWTLTHTPIPDSIFIRWHPGGSSGLAQISPEDWTLGDNGQTITIPDPDGILADGDVFSAQYQFLDVLAEGALLIDASDSSSAIDSWSVPDDAQDGDLLVAIAMLSTGRDVTTLNGYILVGESDPVTHAAHNGTYTYRLGVWARLKPPGSSPVPVLNATGDPQSVCAMLSFTGPTRVTGFKFDTVSDDTVAATPAASSGSINIWGTISNLGVITPSRGTVRGNVSGQDIDMCVVTGTGTGTVDAESSVTAGWCVATLSVV